MIQRIWGIIRPQNISNTLKDIDQQARLDLEKSGGFFVHKNRIWVVLMVACFCLLLVHYLKYSSSFYTALLMAEKVLNIQGLTMSVKTHHFSGLITYGWWTFWN